MDGKPRYDGVCNFLVSRGIALPFGEPSDDERTDTCCGLGNRKNRRFKEHLETHGVELFDSTVELIHRFRAGGKRVAVVSASKNCEAVLRKAGLLDLFDVMVSGREAAAMSLAGKPAPDTYLKAAELLHTEMERSVVFEDSVTGIQAGKAAGAGFIVGIDRAADASALSWYGADVVVADLSALSLDWRDAPAPSRDDGAGRAATPVADAPAAAPMSGVETVPVTADEDGLRLDRWFKRRYPEVTHGRLEKWLRQGQVRVDGRRAKAGFRLEANQSIRVPPLGDAAMPAPAPAAGAGQQGRKRGSAGAGPAQGRSAHCSR